MHTIHSLKENLLETLFSTLLNAHTHVFAINTLQYSKYDIYIQMINSFEGDRPEVFMSERNIFHHAKIIRLAMIYNHKAYLI